jgi:uncharacterized protein YcfJ
VLIKAAIIKGLIIGGLIGAASSRGRGRRDTAEAGVVDLGAVEPLLASASQRDVDDCAKKLVCR